MRPILSKKGAFELSITTVVIIVIGMALLILGIVLVRNIFSGATQAVDLIDKNVQGQINELFNDQNTKSAIGLANNRVDAKKGQLYSTALYIRNTARGGSGSSSFTYTISTAEIEQGCSITKQEADNFVIIGRSGGPIEISAGDPDPVERNIELRVSDDVPLCTISYDIVIKRDGQPYHTNFFTMNIV